MPRLIEIEDVAQCRSPLAVRAGDVLLLHAAGARILSGGDAVELLGPFTPALVADTGAVLAPMGAPNTVLLRARQAGDGSIVVMTGDPFHAPRSTELSIVVED